MKKTFMVLITAGVLAAFSGCTGKEPPAQPTSTDPRAGMISMSPVQQSTVEAAARVATQGARISPLEIAQKDYLDSYNEYVRLLRESGPQTIETLQALTVYQKNFQIYQMLLKAHGD